MSGSLSVQPNNSACQQPVLQQPSVFIVCSHLAAHLFGSVKNAERLQASLLMAAARLAPQPADDTPGIEKPYVL